MLTPRAAWAVSTISGTVTGTNAAGTSQGVNGVRVVAVSSNGTIGGSNTTNATGA